MTRTRLFLLVWALFAGAVAGQGAGIRVLVRTVQDEPVTDAVVSLVPLDQPVPPAAPQTAPVEVSQEAEEYHPYVTAIRVGTRVDFPNRDKVQHHIYSLSTAKRFEIPLYAPGARESVLFDRPGVVTLGCNIHDWMIAYVVVLPTPYFATTGTDGAAAIATVPGGRYRLEVWHPRLAVPPTREITLAANPNGPPEEFIVKLKPDRRIRRSPENMSGGY